MLDSSPVALPPIRKSLKRSASTASLASMPTPPRTHRKHARGLSRGSCDSDSDANALISSDEDVPDTHKSKKRRTNDAIATDEDAFWLGGSSTNGDTAAAGSSRTLASQAAPLLYRKKSTAQANEVAPVSPPPSNRKRAAVPSHKVEAFSDASLSPPRTPRTRSMTKRAQRDSPANPFLATPEKAVEDSATPSPIATSANASPHTPNNEERPYMLWVFRGQRRLYKNPLYDHANNRPFSPPAADLPIDHPDYSPPIRCPPKILFPEAHRKAKGKKAALAAPAKRGRRARSPSLSGDELDPQDLRPKKLDFGVLDMKNKNNTETPRGRTLSQGSKAVEDPFSP